MGIEWHVNQNADTLIVKDLTKDEAYELRLLVSMGGCSTCADREMYQDEMTTEHRLRRHTQTNP